MHPFPTAVCFSSLSSLLWWMLSAGQAAAQGNTIFPSLPAINLLNNTQLMKWQYYHKPVTTSNGAVIRNSDQTERKQERFQNLSSACDSWWTAFEELWPPFRREPRAPVCWPPCPILKGMPSPCTAREQKCPHRNSHWHLWPQFVFIRIHSGTCSHLRRHFLLSPLRTGVIKWARKFLTLLPLKTKWFLSEQAVDEYLAEWTLRKQLQIVRSVRNTGCCVLTLF